MTSPDRAPITVNLRSSRLSSASGALGAQWGVAPDLSLGFNTCFTVKRWHASPAISAIVTVAVRFTFPVVQIAGDPLSLSVGKVTHPAHRNREQHRIGAVGGPSPFRYCVVHSWSSRSSVLGMPAIHALPLSTASRTSSEESVQS